MGKTLKIRKTWGDFSPTTRIHNSGGQQGKKIKYSKKDRHNWKRDY